MKSLFTLIAAMICISAFSQNNVVISEVFGGGGGTTTPFKNDFVELYNPTNADIDMTDWSIQYNSATGTNAYQLTAFTGKIKAKSFFLIQLGGGTVGADLPTADIVGTLNLSATNGKVALVNNKTALAATVEANGAGIVDYLGYGTANKWEGAAALPALTAAVSAERKANMSSTVTTMAAGGADVSAGNGYDSNNNNLDFVALAPSPQNTSSPSEGGTTVTPAITLSTASLPFTGVQNGTSSAPLNYTISGANLTGAITVTATSVFTISKSSAGTYGPSLSFTAAEIMASQTIFVKFTPTQAIAYTGTITHEGNGLSKTINLSGNGLAVGTSLYEFNTCTTTLSDGFTAFSKTGAQTWACTTFGRNRADSTGKLSAPSGIQITGFATVAVANEDWLISPKIAIDSSSNKTPILTFYSRTKFAGNALQLKGSSNYSGSGNPEAAGVTWQTIPVTFPATDSDTWRPSLDINLSQFRGKDIHLAWIYTSDSINAARWTLDDIQVISSSVAPQAVINISTPAISFDYVKEGTSAIDSINLTSSNLSQGITVKVEPPFQISTNGTTFSSLSNFSNSSGSINQKIYIRINPTAANQSLTGEVLITSGNITKKVKISGNTYPYPNTFDVVNFNIEWFSGPNGPVNDTLQEQNALSIMKRIGADLFACTEIVDTLAFKSLVEKIGATPSEYGYFVSTYASTASNTSSTGYADGQKLAFAFRKSMVQPIKITPLFYTSNTADPAYNNWASGRFPYMLEADVILNNRKQRMYFILIHGKAQNSLDAYGRRKAAAASLKTYLDTNLKNNNFMILGDYNDDLDQTVGSQAEVGAEWPTSSYSVIVNDTTNYKALSLPLSNNGERSTASFADVIDHAIVSSTLNKLYISNTTQILNELTNSIPNYASTTSDHYPLITRFSFETITSTKEEIVENTLIAYPNPSNGIFNIVSKDGRGKIEVLDLFGKKLMSKVIENGVNTIDLSSYPNGTYILHEVNTNASLKVVKN
jgi:trimeric autotransporter adhesin